MKSKISILALFLLVFFGVSQKTYALLNTAKATIFVAAEDGTPIEGAKAGIAFEKNKAIEPGVDISSVDGLTDIEGRFTAQQSNDSNVITYGAEKEGYYYSTGEYRFSDKSTFGWKPWNPELKIVLRKIENPVPMYAKKIEKELPEIDKNIGFDMQKGDWVIPYGQGITSDFYLNLERNVKNKTDFNARLTVKFNNKFDGIQINREDRQYGSNFKLARFAPQDGYIDIMILSVSRTPGQPFIESFKNDDNYFFRIRCEEKDGKLKRGMYGKILGPIKFAPLRSKTAIIVFNYYLNPDYTRNLEFDPKRNLFGNLPDSERVTEP